MTVTGAGMAPTLSATPPADPSGKADGPAPVASPAAPSARVVEAHRPGHACRLFFAKSATVPGCWYRVDLIPNESISCSCPWGRRLGPVTAPAKLCRHLCAVTELLVAERERAVS